MATMVADLTAAHSLPAAHRLRATMAAVRISMKWLGTRKTLSAEQRAQAADTFGAEERYLSAGKKLLDTSHPAFKAVTAVRGRAIGFWRSVTLPYPDPGIRLIRQNDLALFETRLTGYREELDDSVEQLNGHYAELQHAARRRLGRLFNSADYPESLRDMFAVSWDYPSVEPPDYLRELSPELYQQEQARVLARFDEAVRLAEDAFTTEFEQLVNHLVERLSGESDGKPKVFRDSAVGNLREFFERFRALNVRNSADLDALVDRARQVVDNVDPQTLRETAPLRQQVARELTTVQAALEGLLVDRPRRNLLRRAK